MKTLALLALLSTAAFAADGPKLLEPFSEGGAPVNFRMIYLRVPPDTAARIDVELADEGPCFDTSVINWSKSMAQDLRVHSLHFDARLGSGKEAKKSEPCARRKAKNGRMHTVDLPAEKGGILAVISYREGQRVRAEFGKSFSTEGFGPGRPAMEPTRTP